MAKNKYYVRPDGLHESIRRINGKRVPFRGKTDREVDRKILEYQASQEAGRLFGVVADEWEREHEASVSESTRRVYCYAVKRLKAEFEGVHVKDIEPLDVKNYITRFEKQGYSGNTVSTELAVCKMLFAHAVIKKDIRVSPAAEIKKSRGLPYKKRDAMTEEQEQAVKAAGEARTARWWLFGYLLLYTGLRRGEALALSYADIDRKAGVIHITKKLSYASGQYPKLEDHLKSDNGRRDVPLLPPLADALPRDRIGLIFPREDGGFMRASDITKNWRHYCRDVGLNEVAYDDAGKPHETFPITPHCFRHSYATICYEAGVDSRQAAEFLGDTPEVLEGVYTHLRQKRMQDGAQLLTEHFKRAQA